MPARSGSCGALARSSDPRTTRQFLTRFAAAIRYIRAGSIQRGGTRMRAVASPWSDDSGAACRSGCGLSARPRACTAAHVSCGRLPPAATAGRASAMTFSSPTSRLSRRLRCLPAAMSSTVQLPDWSAAGSPEIRTLHASASAPHSRMPRSPPMRSASSATASSRASMAICSGWKRPRQPFNNPAYYTDGLDPVPYLTRSYAPLEDSHARLHKL
jgi:hypothetical protein